MAEHPRVDDHGSTDGVNPFTFMNMAYDSLIGLIPFDNFSDNPQTDMVPVSQSVETGAMRRRVKHQDNGNSRIMQ
jgi:hypothetical protein